MVGIENFLTEEDAETLERKQIKQFGSIDCKLLWSRKAFIGHVIMLLRRRAGEKYRLSFDFQM